MWHVTNNKLYSGSDTSNPVFIVGTQYNFGEQANPLTANWTNQIYRINRGHAGNAVFMCGNYLACGDYDGTSNGQRVIELFSNNAPEINYFIPVIDMWNSSDPASRPRGSHSPLQGTSSWADSGHWKKLPRSGYYFGDTIGTDHTYVSSFSNDPTNPSKWIQNTSCYGTEAWHSNFLNRVKTGSAGSVRYGQLFAWYLFDEPFNTRYRDAATNQYSVWGHYAFCSSIQGDDSRPMMIDIRPDANASWTTLCSNDHTFNILCGNDYAYNMTNSEKSPWRSVNMAKWCYSKVSGSTNQMAMAWLPGYASLNTDTGVSGGSNTCYYTFYGSIIEGARGILWYMSDDVVGGYSDYQDYGVLKTIYTGFTSNRTFKSSVTNRFSDKNVILSGMEITTNWDTNDPSQYSLGDPYPCVLDKKFSAKVFLYSNRYRVFVVNNMDSNAYFKIRINAAIVVSGWSNAYYGTGVNDYRPMSAELGPGFYHLDDTLSGYQYRIYDIGAGNQ